MIVDSLVRVLGPDFTARLVLRRRRCIRAAPVIGWAVGRGSDELEFWFRRYGWRVEGL